MNGLIFSIATQKGGVGKTTTTINLAQALALHKLKVLVVDLDPQGNTTLGLGLDLESIGLTTGDLIRNRDLPVEQVIYQVGDLSLMPAKRSLADVEREMVGWTNSESRLANRLKALRSSYSVILIDTPPTFGPLINSSLNAADSLIVPLDCGIYAMQGIKDLLAEVGEIKEASNPKLEILGYLLTMFDNTKIARDTRDEMIASFGDQVFESVIARSVKLKESPVHGQTIFHYAPTSTGALDYLKLSIEVIQKTKLLEAVDSDLMELAYPNGAPLHSSPAQVSIACAGGAQ